MAQTFSIDAAAIKAALLFASKDKTRAALNAVYFVFEDNKLKIQATDSYTAFEYAKPLPDGCVVVGTWAVDAKALKLLKAKNCYAFEFDGDNVRGMGDEVHAWCDLPTIDGNIPRFSQLMDAQNNCTQYTFMNPAYIMRAGKALDMFYGHASLIVNDSKPNVFTLEDMDGDYRVRVLVMPVRCDERMKAALDKHFEPFTNIEHNDSEEVIKLRAKVAELEAQLAERNEVESEQPEHIEPIEVCKTVVWYDREVAGSQQCKRAKSKHYGLWWVKRTA